MYKDDNTSFMLVNVDAPDLPKASDLAANVTEAGIELNWTAPDLEAATTEDFEYYDAWDYSETIGKWTNIDGDGAEGLIWSGFGIPYVLNPKAFQVYNPSALGLDLDSYPFLQPLSGSQFMSSNSNQPGKANDDWLISPELSGKAQTITLHARSMRTTSGLEDMQILYSTESRDTATFQLLLEAQPYGEWTEYNVDLPEGTKFFAIRNTSDHKSQLHIDDVTFQAQPPTLLGFNIYRDRTLIGSTANNVSTYTDADAESGKEYRYTVTALFDEGESEYSNEVVVLALFVNGLTSNALSIASLHGGIGINGATGQTVTVYTTSGQLLYTAAGSDNMFVPAKRGQYVVSVGNRTANIVVR